MGVEIERKFLLRRLPDALPQGVEMLQGYFNTPAEVTIRVRIAGDAAFLTVKGRSATLARPEFEYSIPVADAREMLDHFCGSRTVAKTRHRLATSGGLVWEIDVYHGRHAGLLTAEIELPAEETPFSRPDWLGEEVTSDPRYTNAALSRLP